MTGTPKCEKTYLSDRSDEYDLSEFLIEILEQ